MAKAKKRTGPPPLSVEEAAACLERVAARSVGVTKDALNWNNVKRPYLTADGWRFVIFNDSGEADYLEEMIAPDGRHNDFAGWYGPSTNASPNTNPGMNPLDFISGGTLKQLLAAIGWNGPLSDAVSVPTQEDPPGVTDLFVPLGNMGKANIAHLREVLDRNDPTVMQNYEDLVEDFIKGFNHAVTQGVPSDWALFAFTQAYAITLGQCLRANFPWQEAAKCLRIIIENAQLSKDFVQQVTTLLNPSGHQQ